MQKINKKCHVGSARLTWTTTASGYPDFPMEVDHRRRQDNLFRYSAIVVLAAESLCTMAYRRRGEFRKLVQDTCSKKTDPNVIRKNSEEFCCAYKGVRDQFYKTQPAVNVVPTVHLSIINFMPFVLMVQKKLILVLHFAPSTPNTAIYQLAGPCF